MRNISAIDVGSHPKCSKSSTWRELAATDFSLELFAPVLEGSFVKWFTDSQSAEIVEVGSMKLDLHRLAVKIFQFCAEHNIRLEVQWIPRTEHEKKQIISVVLLTLMIGRLRRNFFSV